MTHSVFLPRVRRSAAVRPPDPGQWRTPAPRTAPPSPMAQENAALARLIEAFGGLRPMAAALGASVSTVQGWKERGRIPPARAPRVREAAARQQVEPELVEAALAASGSGSTSRGGRGGRGGRGPGRKAAAPGAIQVPAATSAAPSAPPASPPRRRTRRTRSQAPRPRPPPRRAPSAPRRSSAPGAGSPFAAALVLVAAIVWTWADVFADYRIGWEPQTQTPAGDTGATVGLGDEESARPLPFLRPRSESEGTAAPLAAGEAGDRLAVQTVALAETREQVGALSARVQLLEEESEALAGALREARRDVSERAARLDEIERLARTPPSPAAAAALALLQLESLVQSGAPYREALDVATHLAPRPSRTPHRHPRCPGRRGPAYAPRPLGRVPPPAPPGRAGVARRAPLVAQGSCRPARRLGDLARGGPPPMPPPPPRLSEAKQARPPPARARSPWRHGPRPPSERADSPRRRWR